MSTIEFKYEQTEDNVIKQLAGDLRGLKPLNRSNIEPTLVTPRMLKLEVHGLDPNFFTAGATSNPRGHDATSRDSAFKMLQETFAQVNIWAKIDDAKYIIRPDAKLLREKPDDKLIIIMPVEAVSE